MRIIKYKVLIKGISPLIMHNGEGANPVDPRILPDFLQKEFDQKTFLEAGKNLSKKVGKTEADHSKLAKLGFYSSLYLDRNQKVIYPAKCLEKMIIEQSKEFKVGRASLSTKAKRAIFVPKDALLDFHNKNKSLKSLFDLHRYDELVKVNMSKTPRTRAIFEKWSCEFTVELATKIIDLSTLKDILSLGEFYGSLERRPKFGRYKVVSVK